MAPGIRMRTMQSSDTRRLPLSALVPYALPALPLAALTLPLYVIIPTFYTETMGLSLASVGAALLFVRIFDALNDPLIGWLADRWRPSFGRRRAVFALSLIPAAFAAWMLFAPPDGVTALYLTLWGALLSVGYTACLIPYAAWGAEMANGYAERSRVAAAREGLTLVGTLAAISIPFIVDAGSAGAGGSVAGLSALGLAVAVSLPLAGLLTIWRVPEPHEYSTSRISLAGGLRAMAANRPFLRLIASYFLNGLANGIPATLFLYYVSDRLALPEMRGPLLFLYFLCGIAGVPFAVWVAKRIGKHRAWSLAMVVACVVFALVPLIPPGGLFAFSLVCVVTGFLLGFDLALPSSIQADVIDVDTAASGEQRSGFYFAAWSLATKLSLALGVGIVFPLLGLFGFTPGAPVAPESGTAFALSALYAWLPVGFKLAAIAMMWNFPLDESAQGNLRRVIESRVNPA